MKKIISYVIAVMMIFSLIPYTAFAEIAGGDAANAAIFNKDMTIGQSEEINLDLFIRSEVTVESEDSSIVNCAVMGTALILSSGSAIYRSTIKIMPVKIGTTLVTVKSNGEVKATYRINVMAVEQNIESHIGEKPVIEYVSYFDGEITNTNTENVNVEVISKTKRTSTQTVNGLPVIEEQYVYKIEIEYDELGEFDFSLIGSNSGEFYKITANVTDHKWNEDYTVDVEPTCTTEGSQSIHCQLCDEVKEISSIPVTDHEFGEWIIDTPASCDMEGTKHKECNHCDVTEDGTIEKTEHVYEWVIDIPATEYAPGEKHESCIGCGDIRNENTVIEQLTHTHELVAVEPVESTCMVPGNIGYYVCSKCENFYEDAEGNLQLTEEETVIDKLEHTVVVDHAVAVTCTIDGITEGSHCSTCNTVFEIQKIILAPGHSYGTEWILDGKHHWHECVCGEKSDKETHEFAWIVDKEATEDETGIKHEECGTCGMIRNETTVIEQLDHLHEMIRTQERDASCTADGNIEYYYCVNCSNYFNDAAGKNPIKKEDTVIKSPGHVYSEWVTMNPSTCTRKGYEFTSCMNCGVVEIRETPLKNHRLQHSIINPTCTAEGASITSCKDCKYQVSDAIPATGHSVHQIPAVSAGCIIDGATAGTKCLICNEILKAPELIPATGHNYGDWITEYNSTCSTEGSKRRACLTCGQTETASIEKLMHMPVLIPEVKATCTKTGLTQGIQCSVCSGILLAQVATPVREHNWGSDYIVDRTARTNRSGYISLHCSDCNVRNEKSTVIVPQIKKTTAATLTYNGKSRTPLVTVVDYKGGKLKRNQDFTVVYKNSAGTKTVKPKNVGSYKAVVTFKGKYSGSVTKDFKINPKSTAISKLTRPAKKQIKVTWQKRTTQVTGYQIQYSTTKNFTKKTTKTLKVKNYKTSTKTINNLKSKKKYWFKIRTYKTVGKKTYYSAWSKVRNVTTK